MYVVGRNWFGEGTGRLALLLGAFWYELVGYAHKPLTEVVATTILLGLMALVSSRIPRQTSAATIAIGLLGVLLVAVRFQYAPVAAAILLAYFLYADPGGRLRLILSGVAGIVLVGAFEYLTWGDFLWSYRLNLAVNLALNEAREGSSSIWHYPGWLLLASCGVGAWAAAGAIADVRRRRILCVLLLAVLIPHLFQVHREYRFVFAAIPLWLLLFSDALAVGLRAGRERGFLSSRVIAGIGLSAAASVLGILNAIPMQHWLYRAGPTEFGKVNFLSGQDPMLSAYRYLAKDDTVTGVWDTQREYFWSGGYYRLHRAVPFYDLNSGPALIPPGETVNYVSHIIAGPSIVPEGVETRENGQLVLKADGNRSFDLPVFVGHSASGKLMYWDGSGRTRHVRGFDLARDFGESTVWSGDAAVESRPWKRYRITPDGEYLLPLMLQVAEHRDTRPAKNFNIEWADRNGD